MAHPLGDIDREFEHFRRRAGGLLRRMAPAPVFPFGSASLRPAVDVYETPEAIIVVLEASGMSEEDIQVFVEGHALRVRGSRAHPVPDDAIRCHLCEIAAGPFDVVIPLPPSAATLDTRARLAQGYLRVAIAKTAPLERQVPVHED